MNYVTSTIWWVFSITLSVLSLIFAFFAYFYSSRSNNSLKFLFRTKWIHEEATNLFFNRLKTLLTANTKVLNRFNEKQMIKYMDYFLMASETRMFPISLETQTLFHRSKYDNILKNYQLIKKNLDDDFFKIIELKNSESMEFIEEDKIQQLIKYHQNIRQKVRNLIVEYSNT